MSKYYGANFNANNFKIIMIQKEKNKVQEIIDNEGFDYTFDGYSSFKEIDDETFHQLRLNYLKAKEELENYLL